MMKKPKSKSRNNKKIKKYPLNNFLKDNQDIILVIGIFIIIRMVLLLKYHLPIWDEATYIGMGKFLYSGGTAGYFEILRPLGMPLLLGLFWKAGLNPVFFGVLFEIAISAAVVFMVYKISSILFNKWTGLLSSMLLVITPLFFSHSYRILSGIPSSFFVLLAVYLFITKKNMFLVGVFVGIAFMFRFPNGIMLVAIGLALMINLVSSKKYFLLLKQGALYIAGFLVPVLPFLVFNYIRYVNEVSKISHAIFRPFIYGAAIMSNETLWMYDFGYLFYFTEIIQQNFIFLFALAGIAYLFVKNNYHDFRINTIIFAALMYLAYFTQLTHNEARFAIIFLPYISILAGYGFYEVYDSLCKKYNKGPISRIVKISAIIILIASFHQSYSQAATITSWQPDKEPAITSFYKFFEKNMISGKIFTTDPVLAAYTDNPLQSALSLDRAINDYNEFKDNLVAVAYSPKSFYCRDTDEKCKGKKSLFLQNLMNDNKLVFYESYDSEDYFIFSNEPSLEQVDHERTEKIYDSFNLIKEIKISKNPFGKKTLLSFYEDSAATINREEGKGSIWKYELFTELNDLFLENGISLVWGLVPKDISEMGDENIDYMKTLLREHPHIFSVVQAGFDHQDNGKGSEFVGLPLQVQIERISKGMKLIKQGLDIDIKGFAPPFNSLDLNTFKALEGLGFDYFTKNAWPPADYDGLLNSYDNHILYVKSWSDPVILKQLPELTYEFDHAMFYNDYIIINIPYFLFDNPDDIKTLAEFVDYIKRRDVMFLSLDKIDEWYSFRNQLVLEYENSNIHLSSPTKSPWSGFITLEFTRSEEYSVSAKNIDSFFIKNTDLDNIELCMNNICHELSPGETKKFFLT